MTARVSHIKETKVIELLNKGRKPWRHIIRNKFPLSMEIENIGWIKPENYRHKEMIQNWRGSFDPNIRLMDFIPIVKLSTLLDSPEIGTNFYGLVSFQERATPSDYMKAHCGSDIKIYEASSVETIDRNLKVVGDGIVIRKGYYHSFPVERVDIIDIPNQLEKIIVEAETTKELYESIDNLLGLNRS